MQAHLDASMAAKRIPITIIGGFLGAGKTTLLNRILRKNSGIRFAVLVNDYGEINIDARLLSGNDNGNIIDLPNGCICCTLARGLVNAIESLLQASPLPEQIVIETSGISSPGQVKQLLDVPELKDRVFVLNTLTLVDALNFRKIAPAVTFMQDQIKSADLLILNKTDLVSKDNLQAMLSLLASIAPDTPIFQAKHSEIPFDLLGQLPGRDTGSKTEAGSTLERESPELHSLHQDYTSWTFQTKGVLSWEKLRVFMDNLPAFVIRVKGFVHLAEHPMRRCVVQVASGQVNLSVEDNGDDRSPAAQIVFIGEHELPIDEFCGQLLACRVE